MTAGRRWSEDDIAKLKRMAGRRPTNEIAVELGRSVEATVAVASKLKLSLRTRFNFGRTTERWSRGLPANVATSSPGVGSRPQQEP